jgi:hypothetical protein
MILRYILIVFFLSIATSLAAPGTATKKLINNPPSMMDFGISRLSQDMEKLVTEVTSIFNLKDVLFKSSVLYDFSDDRIIVEFRHFKGEITRYQLKRHAKAFEISSAVHIINLYNNYFAHKGYSLPSTELTREEEDNFNSRLKIIFTSVSTNPGTYAYANIDDLLVFYSFTMKDKNNK